ncbi:shikimate kinase [Candidatus Pelagibacter bacterium]|nr:shikimate kinase [Candidatus Pelagibacter bacterium]
MKNQIQKTYKLYKNLILTGMMGVGKSTVGKSLAKKLQYNFIDIDKLIEIKEKTSINLIFKNKGENYFRKVESGTALQELKKNNSVISLGGGTFLNKSIRISAKKTSVTFWLDVDVEILVKRLNKTQKRPLLYKKDINDTIKKIYLKRKKIYKEADYRIKCNFLTSGEIVSKVLGLYEKSRN